MKPFVYSGIDASVYFWAMVAIAVILFVFVIIEEKKNNGWKRLSILTVGVPTILFIVGLGLFINADHVKKADLNQANDTVIQSIEKTGLTVVDRNTINVSPNLVSATKVSFPDGKADVPCRIFSPKDVNAEIAILCGASTNGMTPEGLAKWFKAGEPEDVTKFEVTKEESQRVVNMVTLPEQ